MSLYLIIMFRGKIVDLLLLSLCFPSFSLQPNRGYVLREFWLGMFMVWVRFLVLWRSSWFKSQYAERRRSHHWALHSQKMVLNSFLVCLVFEIAIFFFYVSVFQFLAVFGHLGAVLPLTGLLLQRTMLQSRSTLAIWMRTVSTLASTLPLLSVVLFVPRFCSYLILAFAIFSIYCSV